MSEEEEHSESGLFRKLFELLEHLIEWFEGERPHLHIVLGEQSMTTTSTRQTSNIPLYAALGISAVSLTDTGGPCPVGLSLSGSNPNNLTIESAEWTADGTILTVTQTAPALTATVEVTPGVDGDGTISAVVTMSDGSTLTSATLTVPVVAGGPPPTPLTVSVVLGSQTPSA